MPSNHTLFHRRRLRIEVTEAEATYLPARQLAAEGGASRRRDHPGYGWGNHTAIAAVQAGLSLSHAMRNEVSTEAICADSDDPAFAS